MPKKKSKERPFFQHCIIELFNVDRNLLLQESPIRGRVEKFIKRLKEKVVYQTSYNFTPHGTTLIFVLASSHLIVHTWPENNYLHLDLLTCSHSIIRPAVLSKYIKVLFKEKNFEIKIISY